MRDISLGDGALFIADAHYPTHGEELEEILLAIAEGNIEVGQLFLMGDIFDLLFGHNEKIAQINRHGIEMIESVSQRCETIYLEGNHDFTLSDIFGTNLTVVPRNRQPLRVKYGDKDIYLSHGDLYRTGRMYDIYSRIVRSPALLSLLSPVGDTIIETLLGRLVKKDICREFEGFQKRAEEIVSDYPAEADLIIEGHYHMGGRLGRYVSLPSLACQKSVSVFEGGEMRFIPISTLLPHDRPTPRREISV
jgi:UDP-2,3-diacylglucosamine hydrolase